VTTLAIGIWVKVDKKHLLDLTKDVSGTDLNETDVPSLLDNVVTAPIVIGAFLFGLSLFGFYGALSYKKKLGKVFLKYKIFLKIGNSIYANMALWLLFSKKYLECSLNN